MNTSQVRRLFCRFGQELRCLSGVVGPRRPEHGQEEEQGGHHGGSAYSDQAKSPPHLKSPYLEGLLSEYFVHHVGVQRVEGRRARASGQLVSEILQLVELSPTSRTLGQVRLDPARLVRLEQGLEVGGELFSAPGAVHDGTSASCGSLGLRRVCLSRAYARDSRLVTVPTGTCKWREMSAHDMSA